MKIFKTTLFMTLTALLLTGCMVGPDYAEPEIAMPTQFTESNEEDSVQDAGTDGDFCRWWKHFDDPFLDTLLSEAFEGNYDFRIALEKIVEARATYSIQRSKLWPEIDFTAQATRTLYSQNVFGAATFGFAYQNFFEVGFDAIWELDLFGKIQRGKRADYDAWQATQFNAEAIMISVLSETVRHYVNIRADQQQIEIIKALIKTDEEQLELTEALFQSGLDSEIEVSGLLAQLESYRAKLPPLEISLKQTIYALSVLLGKQPESLAKEFDTVGPIPNGVGKVPLGLPSDLLRRRPDIRSAERQLAEATERIGVAVADLFPQISLTGSSYGLQSMSTNTLFKSASRAWTVGPSIAWDILDFGRVRGMIDQKKSIQRQALLAYEKTIITALEDVEGALVAYFKEQERSAFLSDQVAANRRSLELTQDLFNAGLANDLQVLQDRLTLLSSQSTLLDSQRAVTNDFIALYKALGGNWECSSTP